MTSQISAQTLRSWLYDGAELALLDVREPGQMIQGHILFSAPLPFSVFEARLSTLAPNKNVRMVLCDAGDGVAQRAAVQASAMGYADVVCLEGGVTSWADAGHTLYRGVNVPSKAFGELVEHAVDTPRLSCEKIAGMQKDGANMVIVDGRPLEEYTKMSIPGASCCPNGELALRAASFAPEADTTIIVNCAGRTRSIIGAQTLIDMGIPNPVYAMENGTQGWTLAGMELDSGRIGTLPDIPAELASQRSNADALASKHGVETISGQILNTWLADPNRTVFLLDVRTSDERAGDPETRKSAMASHGVVHAPGGQLVQATDQWIGVRNAAVVVLDTEGVRARITAAWLRRIGHQAVVLDGGADALSDVPVGTHQREWQASALPSIAPDRVQDALNGGAVLLDLRSSASYRAGHVQGALWTIRPRLPKIAADGEAILLADDETTAALVAKDLRASGASGISQVAGHIDDLRTADLTIVEIPVPLIYLDEKRSFGGVLDNGETRLKYYREVLADSIARVGEDLITQRAARCGQGASRDTHFGPTAGTRTALEYVVSVPLCVSQRKQR